MGISKKIYFTFLVLAVTGLSSCKQSRRPSKERFEEISRVIIPEGITVQKDEFYDMSPDYTIIYEVKIPQSDMTSLIKKIKRSGLYHITVPYKRKVSMYEVQIDNDDDGIWKQTETGYNFFKEDGKTQYSIDIDTTSMMFMAWEGYTGGLVLK